MSSKEDKLKEVIEQSKLNHIAKEYELVKKEMKKIEARAVKERDQLLTRGLEIQGAMRYVREVYDMTPKALTKDQVDMYVSHNINGTYRETLKSFVLDNMTDNLLAVELIEKYNLNEPDKARAQAQADYSDKHNV